MNNADTFNLASLGITANLSSQDQTPQLELAGMQSVTLDAKFVYGGSGGGTVTAIVQTRINDTDWRDIARFDFAVTTRSAHCTLNAGGGASKAITTYAALSVEGVNDGILGDRLRAVVSSTGTAYGANTTLDISAAVR
jgi:hypothetical protein